jgi:hypothetical protein
MTDTKIVPLPRGAKTPAKTEPPSAYPQPSAAEMLEETAIQIVDCEAALRYLPPVSPQPVHGYTTSYLQERWNSIKTRVFDAKWLMEEPEFRELQERTERIKGRASKKQLVEHLGLLVASFPPSKATGLEMEVFTRMLFEDVGALRPTVMALEIACRKLRRTMKFTPAICEVREAVIEAEKTVSKYGEAVRRLPESLRKAEEGLLSYRNEVTRVKAQEEEELRRRQERRHAEIRRRLAEGDDCLIFDFGPDLIEEVKAEMAAERRDAG